MNASNTKKMSSWIKRNSVVITIYITAFSAIGVVLGGLSGWINNNQTILLQPSAEPSPALSEPSNHDHAQRVQALYEIARERLDGFDRFLFADHQRDTGPGGRSTIHIYAANAETFVKIDEQACSYPDATEIETQTEQRALLVSCSFPSWFRPSLDEDDSEYAYAVTVVRLFDADTKIVGSLSCKCPSISIASADFDRQAKTILFSVYTTGTLIAPGGLDRSDVTLPEIVNPLNAGPARVFRMQFDARWNPVSFELVNPGP
jgi:hypothetical protein